MITSILRVLAMVVIAASFLVACADKGYIKVDSVNLELQKVHSTAVACSEPVVFSNLKLRAVNVETVEVDGKQSMSLTPQSLRNLQYNLSVIDKAVGVRQTYAMYLRECLLAIVDQSVKAEDTK